MCVCVLQHVYKSQKAIFKMEISTSIMWVPGTELISSGLVANALPQNHHAGPTFIFLMVVGTELRLSCILRKCSTAKLHLQVTSLEASTSRLACLLITVNVILAGFNANLAQAKVI